MGLLYQKPQDKENSCSRTSKHNSIPLFQSLESKFNIRKCTAKVLAKLSIASIKDKLCFPGNWNSSIIFFRKSNHKSTAAMPVHEQWVMGATAKANCKMIKSTTAKVYCKTKTNDSLETVTAATKEDTSSLANHTLLESQDCGQREQSNQQPSKWQSNNHNQTICQSILRTIKQTAKEWSNNHLIYNWTKS